MLDVYLMGAFREQIAKEVRKELMNPEFDSRRSKNGGRIFWVKAASATGFGQFVAEHPAYDDNVAAVHTTMSSAAAAVRADTGDEVRVTAGHTEEFEKVFSLSTSGVRWVGEGYGTKVPVITISGAIHGVALAAAGVEFENFRFAAPPIDGPLSMIKLRAAGCRVKDIVGVASGAANNFIDCIVVGAAADDNVVENVRFWTDVTPITGFLHFTDPISRFAASGFYATGSVATAGIYDESTARIKDADFSNINVAVRGSAKPAATIDAAGSSGQVRNSFFAGTHTTLANNGSFGTQFKLNQVYLLEDTVNAAQGALIPAVDTD